MCCPADAPTDDISGEHVDDERHINEPGQCRDIGKIRDPQPVGSWRLELAIDPIERAWSALVADGRALWLAADDALQAEVTHEPLDRAAGDRKALPTHLPPDLPHAVDLEVLIETPQDLRLQNIVPLFACRSAPWCTMLANTLVIGRRGDLKQTADRLDPVFLTVRVDEDRDRGTPRGASPPTPPGIRVTYHGGSIGLGLQGRALGCWLRHQWLGPLAIAEPGFTPPNRFQGQGGLGLLPLRTQRLPGLLAPTN